MKDIKSKTGGSGEFGEHARQTGCRILGSASGIDGGLAVHFLDASFGEYAAEISDLWCLDRCHRDVGQLSASFSSQWGRYEAVFCVWR